ncbi:hypothetical protein S245_058106, partial [Arachis hypogaea]
PSGPDPRHQRRKVTIHRPRSQSSFQVPASALSVASSATNRRHNQILGPPSHRHQSHLEAPFS